MQKWISTPRPRGFSRFAITTAAMVLMAGAASAAISPSGFTTSTVASGLSEPTLMSFAPDGRIFVSEKAGRLRIIKNGALLSTPFMTLSVSTDGERGLLGTAFDPNFATNRWIYVYYTNNSPLGNRVSRFRA